MGIVYGILPIWEIEEIVENSPLKRTSQEIWEPCDRYARYKSNKGASEGDWRRVKSSTNLYELLTYNSRFTSEMSKHTPRHYFHLIMILTAQATHFFWCHNLFWCDFQDRDLRLRSSCQTLGEVCAGAERFIRQFWNIEIYPSQFCTQGSSLSTCSSS